MVKLVITGRAVVVIVVVVVHLFTFLIFFSSFLMILNHFEGSEKETWKQTQGRSQSVLQYYTVQCVYSRSTAASYRLCTHAALQRVLHVVLQCVLQVVYSRSAAVCVTGCVLTQCCSVCCRRYSRSMKWFGSRFWTTSLLKTLLW